MIAASSAIAAASRGEADFIGTTSGEAKSCGLAGK
jgi:hypothetical protein